MPAGNNNHAGADGNDADQSAALNMMGATIQTFEKKFDDLDEKLTEKFELLAESLATKFEGGKSANPQGRTLPLGTTRVPSGGSDNSHKSHKSGKSDGSHKSASSLHLKSNGELDGQADVGADKETDTFPARVSLGRKDGSVVVSGGNEVFKITAGLTNRRMLIDEIKGQYMKLESSEVENSARRNVPDNAFWGPHYVVESLKVNWDPLTPAAYDQTWGPGRNETEITDYNVAACLQGLKASPVSGFALEVLIVPGDESRNRWKKSLEEAGKADKASVPR